MSSGLKTLERYYCERTETFPYLQSLDSITKQQHNGNITHTAIPIPQNSINDTQVNTMYTKIDPLYLGLNNKAKHTSKVQTSHVILMLIISNKFFNL